MSTPRRTLQDRLRGQRRSKNIEDRRGQKVPIYDESDKYPPIYQEGLALEDINEPVETYAIGSHVPIWQARRDLDRGRKAAHDWLVQRPVRRKRKVRY